MELYFFTNASWSNIAFRLQFLQKEKQSIVIQNLQLPQPTIQKTKTNKNEQ